VDINYEKLIHLQELDKNIISTSLFLENIPIQIKQINEKKDACSQILTLAKEKMVHNQKKRRDLEAEVKDIKEKASKYNRQLNAVKTNIEYKSLLKEIEETQQKIDRSEEEIISEMLFADEIEEEIKAATQKYNEEGIKFSKEKKSLEHEKEELESKRKEFEQEKKQILPQIPPDQQNIYLKIFDKNNSIALSPVKGEFCTMCHVRVRPQMLNEIKKEEKIILCENCGRILYWPKE
jgi:predicted  nucleic acid-binding Zn-ribbon protein